jgi:hypothetical protein
LLLLIPVEVSDRGLRVCHVFRSARPDRVVACANLHTANAETINRLSAGADLFSTTLMVAALPLYASRPSWRRYGFYLLPAALAMPTNEVSVVFPLLLLVHLLLEKGLPLAELPGPENRQAAWRPLVMAFPSIPVCPGLLALSCRMSHASHTSSNLLLLGHVLAQPLVILHYSDNFLKQILYHPTIDTIVI